MEENILKWQPKKREKYLKLAKSDDYEVIFMVWEVGARGWIPTNVSADLKKLGFTTKERQKVITDCRLAALRSSHVIRVQRYNNNFSAARMHNLNNLISTIEEFGTNNYCTLLCCQFLSIVIKCKVHKVGLILWIVSIC